MLKLDEIMGQRMAVKVLKAALKGKTGISYLFTGPDGVGKKTAAFAWIRAMMCEQNGDDACGVCKTCLKVSAGSHPDVIYLKPEARDKKVKEEIDITHIREVIRRFSFKPYEAKKKVLIIDGADRMNIPAANAFLKTLEEPQGEAIIILLAENISKLPLTIISRCQTVRFRTLAEEDMIGLIMSRQNVPEDQAKTIAALSKGSCGRALSDSLDEERQIRDEAMALISRAGKGVAEAYKLAKALDKAKDRRRVDRLLEAVQEILRDMLSVKIKGKCDKLINSDIRNEISGAASSYSRRRLFRAFNITLKLGQARQWNINPFLVVSLLALELAE